MHWPIIVATIAVAIEARAAQANRSTGTDRYRVCTICEDMLAEGIPKLTSVKRYSMYKIKWAT